jgi:hypothetical protein
MTGGWNNLLRCGIAAHPIAPNIKLYHNSSLPFPLPSLLPNTSRRGSSAPLEYPFPGGPLVKLMLTHIKQGHQILTQGKGDKMVMLFVARSGKEFSGCTFVHYWTQLMKTVNTRGQEYFPPSMARTMFVEEFTAAHGSEPDTWDGCAAIMGNTTAQWRASYNPSRRKREARRAVSAFSAKRARVDAEEEDADYEDEGEEGEQGH